ncbi:secretin N-terminal domain-containing protein [Pseudochelatococcus sp. G4_1912]|uniref:secretin N-terminal domain-containing protein n=1 Tax=Pseudochelatococcus sp. G4_1912 TaxID=3114288 RepID=UPI0039C6D31D
MSNNALANAVTSAFSKSLMLVFALIAMVALASCGALDGDSCTVSPSGQTSSRCKDGFFSASRQRAILYRGNDTSLLYTGEAIPTGGVLDTARLNGPPPKVVPFVGYVNNSRIDYSPTPENIQRDIIDLQNAGAPAFDPEARVTVDLKQASINFMLKQLLGGTLGVNYIAPDDLGGSITFRTEEPIPKSQLIYVVRDILARNRLSMQYFNGVYHIGAPDVIAALEANAAQAQSTDLVTRVVRLDKNNATNVINIASKLLPENVSLVQSNVSNTIIVRAPNHDMDQIERTLQSISRDGLGDDNVSVVPVHNSTPEKLAAKLIAFYETRIPAGGDMPTIVPLERQRALLVAARDMQVMNGIKQLAQLMDREASDEPTLRVIELRHLSAEEIAKPLSQIFGEGAANGVTTPTASSQGSRNNTNGSTSRNSQSGQANTRQMPTIPQQTPLADSDLGSEAAPKFNMAGLVDTGAADSAAQADRRQNAGNTAANARSQSGGLLGEAALVGQIRIVPDPRTNTLMVYSTYADFQRIRDVLMTMDVPQSQLAIEAMIVEVELNDQLESGVQMYLQGPHVAMRTAGNTLPAGGTGAPEITEGNRAFMAFGGQVGNYRIEAILSSLQAVTKVKVISSPYLTVLDGKTARLVVGDQIPYAVSSQTSQSSGNVTVTQEIQIKDTGIILDVTPRIYSSNSVALRINQSVSTPSSTIQNGNPVIATRTVESNVLGQSGRTILLGGLIQDRFEKNESSVPVLGKTPILGDLFTSKTDRVRRVELLIMLTPRVIRNTSQLEDITKLLRSKLHVR